MIVVVIKPERTVASAYFEIEEQRDRLRCVVAELPCGSEPVDRALAGLDAALTALADMATAGEPELTAAVSKLVRRARAHRDQDRTER